MTPLPPALACARGLSLLRPGSRDRREVTAAALRALRPDDLTPEELDRFAVLLLDLAAERLQADAWNTPNW